MSEPTDDPLLASIVARAHAEPIDLSTIVRVVRSVGIAVGGGDEDVRTATVALVREALRRRLLVVGSPGDEFEPWNVSPDDAIDRIARGWRELERDPRPGEVAAFATLRALGYA